MLVLVLVCSKDDPVRYGEQQVWNFCVSVLWIHKPDSRWGLNHLIK